MLISFDDHKIANFFCMFATHNYIQGFHWVIRIDWLLCLITLFIPLGVVCQIEYDSQLGSALKMLRIYNSVVHDFKIALSFMIHKGLFEFMLWNFMDLKVA